MLASMHARRHGWLVLRFHHVEVQQQHGLKKLEVSILQSSVQQHSFVVKHNLRNWTKSLDARSCSNSRTVTQQQTGGVQGKRKQG